MSSDPKPGDKVLIKSDVLARLRKEAAFIAFSRIDEKSWAEPVVVQIVLGDIIPDLPNPYPYILVTSEGHGLAADRDEFIFPLENVVKTCSCDLRVLMNRGCQCGAIQ